MGCVDRRCFDLETYNCIRNEEVTSFGRSAASPARNMRVSGPTDISPLRWKYCERKKRQCYLSKALWEAAVSPLLMLWRCCSLALSPRYNLSGIIIIYPLLDCNTHQPSEYRPTWFLYMYILRESFRCYHFFEKLRPSSRTHSHKSTILITVALYPSTKSDIEDRVG